MKRSLFILGCVIALVSSVMAQDKTTAVKEDVARIAITPYVDPDLGFNKEVTKQLNSKMTAMLAKAGMAGGPNQRFILAANVSVLSEDIVVTTKEMFQYELEVYFVLGDGIEGTKYASNSITVKGIGDTKAGAYLAAIKKISTSHSSFKSFFEKGKQEIVNHFATKCDFMLKEAQAMADRKEYDKAISSLVSVPDACEECYHKAMDASVVIYQRMIENDCQKNINSAKMEIANNNWDDAVIYLYGYTPDMDCYSEVEKLLVEIKDHQCADAIARAQAAWASRDAEGAAEWLAEVAADSKCYPEAQELQKDIAANLDEQARKEWDFKVRQHRDEVSIAKASIRAVRDIGVAYAENQPAVVYRTYGWWW